MTTSYVPNDPGQKKAFQTILDDLDIQKSVDKGRQLLQQIKPKSLKAVLLCGGTGSRLGSLTYIYNKHLISYSFFCEMIYIYMLSNQKNGVDNIYSFLS
jgi:hypothetical protein